MKQQSYNKSIWPIKLITVLIIILTASSVAFSQNTVNQTAREYAADFFSSSQQSKIGLKSAVSVSSLTQCYQSAETVKTPLFVFQQADKGFAMVAKSHSTYKVVGYSDEEIFQSENIPPQLLALMTYYEDSLQFINPVSKVSKAGTPIVPALLDEYGIRLDQYIHTELSGCPTGCIASAVTQIMLYHAARLGKPIKGYGSHCYTDASHGELCADFENADYNSNNMLLSLHVGHAMEMQYCGSPYGSVPNRGFGNPLYEHFMHYTGNAIPDNFFIKNELEHQRPVYIELNGSPVGHAFVLDGYDSRGYYHVNFGWGGYYNGYYLLNNSDRLGISNFKFYTNITSPSIISPTTIPVNSQDSLALVAVHNALGGFEVTNWDLTKPVWIWPGILTMNDRVIRLNINSSLPPTSQQTIAPEIGNLTALQELSFFGCFNGTIPTTISKLTDLKKLIISNSIVYIAPTVYKGNLKCELPADIDKLTKLEWLSLYNVSEGTIPASIGNLTNLKILSISQDTSQFGKGNLTGPIPVEIGNLSMLNQLNLSNQNINGDIPSIINNLTEIREMDLSGNQLSGSVPAMNLPNILHLKLNDNVFSELTEGNGNCPDLTNIELQNNKITGSLPAYFGNLTALKSLNLSDNQINSLPEEIGNLMQLERLVINNNQLLALPNGLALNLNLKHFSASNNQIKYIPDNFAQSGSLETLDLSNNQITNIPEEVGNCPNIYEVFFNQNKIVRIPPTFANIRDGATVLLQDNEMQGEIPEELMTAALQNNKHVRLDSNRFVFNNIPKSDQLKFGVRNQKNVLLTKQLYKVQIGDTVSIDVRTISHLSNVDNEYYWVAYPDFLTNSEKNEQIDALENNAVLKVIINEQTVNNKYHCRVFNSTAPSYSFEYNGTTYTSPCMESLNTDTIAFKLASDEEIIAEKYTEEFVTSLAAIPDKSISDQTVTLVPPLTIKRGVVQWEASSDGTIWEIVSEQMERADLKANVKSISNENLILTPKNTAYYRCSILETDCNPLYSDKLKVNALGNVLFDEIINVTEESRTIDVDSIEIVVPRNFHENDFRLTITKIDNPPAAPKSVIAGSAYDVTVSFSDEFESPLLIKLKNIDKTKVKERDIDKFKAVYFDDINRKWELFDHADLSLKDSTLAFTTNHLTKLSWWWDEEVIWGYTDVYERNNIRVFYKEDDLDYMKFGYGRKQTSQPWHISSTPLLVQDITEYLPKVMAKYKSLGLDGPNGKFSVYVKKMDDAGCVGILGMLNGYMSISRDMLTPEELRQVLAHEFMHYTQDYYISANPGNSFWMEAHATLADRMVWNETEVPISESEELLESGRTSKNSIFYSLSKPWDYWDKSIVTNNMFGNIHYNYLAGTFLHYMRSYRGKSEKLEPATLLKETSWFGSWRTYLSSYVNSNFNTLLGEEYEDFVKYILSGKNEKFTLINKKGNPYSYLQDPKNKGVFTSPVTYRFKDGNETVQKDEIEIKIPYLAAKIVLLENICPDSLVLVNYKRKHNSNSDHLVYYATYDYQKQEMTYTNISDSTEFNFLLDARNKENVLTKFNNYSFLLLINKSHVGLSSLIKDFDASFELIASPVLNIESVGMLSIYNGDSPIRHNFGDKLEYIPIGKEDAAWLQKATGFDAKMINKNTSKKLLNNHTYQIQTQYTLVIDQGIIKGSPTMKDSTIYTQTIENNIIDGTIKITEHEKKFYKLHTFIEFVTGADGDIEERLVFNGYTESIDDKTKTYWLKDIMSYLQSETVFSGFADVFGKNIKIFKTSNTAETRQMVSKIDANIKSYSYSKSGVLTSQSELNYVSTDYTNPNLYIYLIIRTAEK